jgi:glycosyltransferase involved in cell wall biosynthesis
MKLLVVSHTPHSKALNEWSGWGPTVREINFLSKYFQVTHIAPQHKGEKENVSYDIVNPHIKLIPTRNRGGGGLGSKLKVLVDSAHYAFLVIRETFSADIVHVRCPANIAMIALGVLVFFPRKKKWIKYAGDWRPKGDFMSYKIQRFLIRHVLLNQVVSINGTYAGEKKFIHHVLNPSYQKSEIESIVIQEKRLAEPVMALFVGGLTPNKGVDVAIKMIGLVQDRGKAVRLGIVGAGPEESKLKEIVHSLALDGLVSFEGWKSKQDLKSYYANAHFIILPSQGEGWPKVVSEAMAFGVVPVVSDVSGIRQTLDATHVGRVAEDFDPATYASIILQYLENPSGWIRESQAAVAAANRFTFEDWSARLFKLFEERWDIKL